MYGSQAENTMTFVLMHDFLTIQATERLMIFVLSRQTSVFIISWKNCFGIEHCSDINYVIHIYPQVWLYGKYRNFLYGSSKEGSILNCHDTWTLLLKKPLCPLFYTRMKTSWSFQNLCAGSKCALSRWFLMMKCYWTGNKNVIQMWCYYFLPSEGHYLMTSTN